MKIIKIDRTENEQMRHTAHVELTLDEVEMIRSGLFGLTKNSTRDIHACEWLHHHWAVLSDVLAYGYTFGEVAAAENTKSDKCECINKSE